MKRGVSLQPKKAWKADVLISNVSDESNRYENRSIGVPPSVFRQRAFLEFVGRALHGTLTISGPERDVYGTSGTLERW